jgi:signal transduction histidine kinase
MRRRLFWSIAGVSMVMGSLVLLAALYSSQRAAVDATKRELQRAATEVVAIIEDTISAGESRPAALADLIALLDENRFVSLLARLETAAGGSELSFGAVAPNGEFFTNGPLFERLHVDLSNVMPGDSRFFETETEIAVTTGSLLPLRDFDLVFIAGLARSTPVVQLADRSGAVVAIFLVMILVSAIVARLLSNSILRRLEPLATASRSLAAGDLATRVPDLGDPELDDLVEAFNEMAEELGESRIREREFLLGVGHDLRTPLTTIAGYSEALEAGEVDDEEVRRIGGVLGVQSRQLSRLIEDISLLARLEQPEFDLRLESVDLPAHVREMVDGFQRRSEELDVNLVVETESAEPIETDPDRVAQIAFNLVENALRFTPAHGTVTVRIGPTENGAVKLEVEDTGSGINEADLPMIFDRHFVAGQRHIRNEGSGLGLSIVEGLAERLGGSVQAESTKGVGTTITVVIPNGKEA